MAVFGVSYSRVALDLMVYVLLFSVAYHDICVHDEEVGIGRRFISLLYT